MLFGSRAKGNAHPDSDYDVAVFIRDRGELRDDLGILSHITTNILNEAGRRHIGEALPRRRLP